MLIGGWRTRKIFERYSIKNEDDLRAAAAMVAGSPIGKEPGKIRPLIRRARLVGRVKLLK